MTNNGEFWLQEISLPTRQYCLRFEVPESKKPNDKAGLSA
jgi:hypothetical protein